MQAVYDSTAFALIVFKTAHAVLYEHRHGGVHALIVKHGLLYYA